MVLFVYLKLLLSLEIINVGKYFKCVFYLFVINILVVYIFDFMSLLSEFFRFNNFVKKIDYCGIRVNLCFYFVNKVYKG